LTAFGLFGALILRSRFAIHFYRFAVVFGDMLRSIWALFCHQAMLLARFLHVVGFDCMFSCRQRFATYFGRFWCTFGNSCVLAGHADCMIL
jgi:hypothetical protein